MGILDVVGIVVIVISIAILIEVWRSVYKYDKMFKGTEYDDDRPA